LTHSFFNALTDRQQTLIERLIALGELVGSPLFPLDVVEVHGFGSFFRGKSRPKDVDLFIRCHRRPVREDFARFLELVHVLRFGAGYEHRFATPREAMHATYCRHAGPSLPGMEDEEFERGKFCEWLDGYSWNMLHPKTISDEVRVDAPEDYARRLIKRRLPNLNVLAFGSADEPVTDEGLCCGFVVSLWSPERRDVAANLQELLRPERLMENTLRELRCFEMQLGLVNAQAELLRAEIDLLFRILFPHDPPQAGWSWHEEWSKDRPELQKPKRILNQRDRAANQFHQEKWMAPVLPAYLKLSYGRASTMVDRLRREIKAQGDTIDLLEDIRSSLVHYQSGSVRSNRPVEEHVAIDVLSRGNARQRKAKEVLLKSMGIPIPSWTPAGDFPPEIGA
jgi:hypothetical protein